MARPYRSALTAAIIGGVLASVLAGCSSDDGGVSLADTKGPAQLLRNSVAGKIPTDLVASQGDTEDNSEACSSDGVKRSWHSGVLLNLNPDHGSQAFEVLENLGRNLSDDGWTGEESSPSGKIHELRLTSTRTQSVIRITATLPADSDGNGASVQVAVNGPCVATDGPDSDEVKHLEAGD
jgi:hypothetical protein